MDGTSPLREAMLPLLEKKHDAATAEVLMLRVEARLDGYTHAEAAQLHPLPEAAAE